VCDRAPVLTPINSQKHFSLFPRKSTSTSNTPDHGFAATSEELDQFIEPSYLPQARRVAAMGRRKIEIKAIKDDRNRSVYVLAFPLQIAAEHWLICPTARFSSAKVVFSRRRMSFPSSALSM
jgi:hypothetical protein